MTKTIIYIGASLLQAPAIRWAKAQGLNVIVTDLNPDAPSISIADGYEQIGGGDVKGMVALATDLNHKSDLVGCYCGSDFGLLAVATVGGTFGLPAPAPKAVLRALNKFESITALRKQGILVPPGGCVETFADMECLADSIKYPLIIKPVDSSGSRGVRTVATKDACKAAFVQAQKFSKSLMVERIIEGKHIDVNGLFVNDVFYPCGLLSRYFSPSPFHYPVWGGEPCVLNEQDCQDVYAMVEAGARALKLTQGPVKADVIMTDKGPVILEIGPRFHGDVSTSFVTPLATGHGAPQAWFAHLSGQPFEHLVPYDRGASVAGWMGIFPENPGTFETLQGLDKARTVPGIEKIETLKKAGYHVHEIADNLAVMGFIWGRGKTLDDLHENLWQARRMISVQMQD